MGEKYPYRDKEWLRERWFSDMTLGEIAEEADCVKGTLTRWAREHGLPHHNAANPWHDEEKLHEMYWEDWMSIEDIADHFDCSLGAIHRTMQRFGIEIRSGSAAHLASRPYAQYRTHPTGYEIVASEYDGKTDQARVHSLVAIANGEDPYKVFSADYAVHHENHIPWDNRPENLTLLTTHEHQKLHAEDRWKSGGLAAFGRAE
jgi:predicted DNA-binding protein YlxM (UPF0122 family)